MVDCPGLDNALLLTQELARTRATLDPLHNAARSRQEKIAGSLESGSTASVPAQRS